MVKDKNYLIHRIRQKQNFLCIGLDPDLSKIPDQFKCSSTPLLDFCKLVVESTKDLAVAYKINIAFFENHGASGWEQLELLLNTIPEECFVIADAKRADIGNTSSQYATYYFKKLNVDALTLHPYMGVDSIQPFLNFADKWSVILGLTSNPGSADFEKLKMEDGTYLFETILEKFKNAGDINQLMFVIGATQGDLMKKVRSIIPDHFLLIPGVGEQGGDLNETITNLRNQDEGILINVSRKILYPNGLNTTIQDIRSSVLNYATAMKKYF
ncbi:MAG: orotidine-5'-phosphate decarboxylase [Saprospiraceae bacterium]|nr:orotidine-5'-phosphate decarboxylase [Saprospiraceae bacterium]